MFRSKIIPKILCCLAALIGFSSTSYLLIIENTGDRGAEVLQIMVSAT